MPINPLWHQLLTRRALETLTQAETGRWGAESAALGTDYCMYPDRYYGDAQALGPYQCFVDDIPFHYIPHEPVEYNNWRMAPAADGTLQLMALPLPENPHHRHCRFAFQYYFERIAEALRGGNPQEAARFAGSFCHVLEDNTMPGHGLEGVDGTDIFVLDRLVDPPPEQPFWRPSLAMDMKPEDPGPVAHVPRLLGLTPAEASFHLYTKFCEAALANRRLFLPLLQAIYAGAADRRRALIIQISMTTVRLVGDMFHTAMVLGGSPATAEEQAALQTVDLTQVRAARRPHSLSGPYRFIGFTRGCSLNARREPVPLALCFNDGTRQPYQKGYGLGAHKQFRFDYLLPAGLFQALRGCLGLHPDLGAGGKVRMQWMADETVLWQDDYGGRHLASVFNLDVSAGGWLTLRGEALTAHWSDAANSLVLAEPVLVRYPDAVRVVEPEKIFEIPRLCSG